MEAIIKTGKLRYLQNMYPSNIKSMLVGENTTRMISTVSSKVDETYAIIADEDYQSLEHQKEMEIHKKRNKSKLKLQHQNLIHGRLPYNEPMADSHLTFKYKRMVFGRYGKSSNVNPGTLWPSKSDIKETIEFESIAYPFNFECLVERQKKLIEEEQGKINERQQRILANLKKLDAWKTEITARAAKKLGDMAKAKAKKDALIEEVRRHFGYKVDPKDEKFKEMLLIKERAQKKKLKEERAKAKQDRLISELMNKEDK